MKRQNDIYSITPFKKGAITGKAKYYYLYA